jgi:hypothetical protein
MAVINNVIQQQIESLINQTKVLEQPQAQQAFVSGLASIIEAAIKSATVTIAPGAIVTVGSATTQTNVAPAVGTLS